MNCSMDVAVACYLHSIHGRLRDAYRGDKGGSKNRLSAFFFLLFLLIHIFIPHSFHFLFSSPLVCKGVAVTSGGHLVWVTSAAQTCFRMPHKRLWHHMLSKEFLKRKHCLQAAYLNHKPCKDPDTYHKNHACVLTTCRRVGDYRFDGRKNKLFFFWSSLEFSKTFQDTFSSVFSKVAKSDFVSSSVRRHRKTLPPLDGFLWFLSYYWNMSRTFKFGWSRAKITSYSTWKPMLLMTTSVTSVVVFAVDINR